MTTATCGARPSLAEAVGSFEPLQPMGGRWRRHASTALSILILAASIYQFRHLDIPDFGRQIPRSPIFWIGFAGLYCTGPLSEFAIFRFLWRLPVAGIIPLLRKQVSNEIVAGYSGELYFYAWVRRHLSLETAPFGAIKDVAILSAAIANIATLLLIALQWKDWRVLTSSAGGGALLASTLGIASLSLIPFIFRRRLLSLARSDLAFIAAVHAARIVATTLMTGLLWFMIHPAIPVIRWLQLATLRLMVSRLPLAPNKDVVFAGLALSILGRGAQEGMMLAILAALLLGAHICVGIVLGLTELVQGQGE